MIGSFGWMELLLILFIVLIIFGAGKIPQLGEGLGKAIKGFKKSINEPEAMDVTPPDETGTDASAAPQQGQITEPVMAQPTAVPQAGEPVPQAAPAPQPEAQAQETRQA
ncbi:MAG: twin-arginine translocase TatA/TatE family subunit [Nitrospira sp.]|nr:twin-arginine translocase TatA/TatE family subunit [Nitrospira sp.]